MARRGDGIYQRGRTCAERSARTGHDPEPRAARALRYFDSSHLTRRPRMKSRISRTDMTLLSGSRG
jgi:hypothetical protein